MRRGLPVFLWLWLSLAFVHQAWFDSPTPVSRLDLLFALVADGEVRIDAYHENTPDKARHHGHYYSDKAPGTVALALPAFAAMYGLQRWMGATTSDRSCWQACSWAACAFAQALPAALGGVLLLAWLERHVPRRAARFTVLGLWLGSLPLPYSTLLFSHAQVIGLVSIAIWALGYSEEFLGVVGKTAQARTTAWGPSAGAEDTGCQSGAVLPAWRVLLAGFCLGLALASEYTAGLVVVGLGAAVTVCGRGRRGILLFAGALPPLVLIPAYSWITLGTPFELPYSHQATFGEMSEGLYAIRWPDLGNLLRLLFGPARGLVFWTPCLLLAVAGWWWIGRCRPGWLWLTYALPLLQVVVISGRTWDWQAGYTLSARYLAPILPLLALPCALGLLRWPRLGAGLVIVSMGLVGLATVTDACPTYGIANPLTGLHLPRLLDGQFAPNLATALLGLPPAVGAAAFGLLLLAGLFWAWRTPAAAGFPSLQIENDPEPPCWSTSHSPSSTRRLNSPPACAA